MNTSQMKQAGREACARIDHGEDPSALVHPMFYPADCSWAEEEIHGLSTALPAGSDTSGLTSRYYTLGELAAS